jgi:hypothetical protein
MTKKLLIIVIPLALFLGAGLAALGPGEWLTGWLSYSGLLALAFWLMLRLWGWAGAGRTLAWMVALAFVLRLAVGVGLYLALPVDGYDDPDDQAGFYFRDAHRRNDQAWELARSDVPILSAFNKTYHTDQYGGLLAFTSLAYRYLSPDVQRPALLIVLSAIVAALGLPFAWRAARLAFGEQLALTACWVLVLYPESLLLGGAAMREPYLITFGAVSMWGFVDWQFNHARHAWTWLGVGLAGMLLVSPVVALVTLAILGGWAWMVREHRRMSWLAFFAFTLVFLVGLLLLGWALNRQGNFDGSPLGVVAAWFGRAVQWDVYQLERGSGWVQKLFDEMPDWLHLPFVTGYGVLQPVLPAAFIEPTTLTWRISGIARALGWYLLWPLLLYALVAAWKNPDEQKRRLWLWLTALAWAWIILTALRGGGDQWDNPRYRTILLLWQALVAAYAWRGFRLRSDSWLVRIWLVEGIFLAFFTQWYLSRYLLIGKQIPFGWMVAIIVACSLGVLVGGGWWDRTRHRNPAA